MVISDSSAVRRYLRCSCFRFESDVKHVFAAVPRFTRPQLAWWAAVIPIEYIIDDFFPLLRLLCCWPTRK